MILTCSVCGTRFAVDPAKIGPGGRVMRCGKCGHEWKQAPLAEPVLALEPAPLFAGPSPVAPVAALTPLPRQDGERARSGAFGWALFLLVVAAVAAGAVLGRDRIVSAWPAAGKLYAQLGLAPEATGDGLAIRNVSSKTETDGDKTVLIVIGQVANISHETRNVPTLHGVLRDAKDRQIRDWTFSVTNARLAPGEVTAFETRVVNPPVEAIGLRVAFDDGM